jgi:excisionase family DNA binding protein
MEKTPTLQRQFDPVLETARDASRRTGIRYSTLRDCVFRGDLPVIRFGKAWYFERAAVDDLIERMKQTYAQPAGQARNA